MKRWRSGTIFAILLLAMITGQVVAQENQPKDQIVDSTSTEIQPEGLAPSWSIGWLNNNASTKVGIGPSIAYNPVDGLTYVSFYDYINGRLMLAKQAVPGGSGNCGTGANWVCSIVDSSSKVGLYSSLDIWKDPATTDWKLGISYYDAQNSTIKYAEWNHTGSSAVWTIYNVYTTDPLGAVGSPTSLKFYSSGYPTIAFHRISGTSGYLELADFVGGGGNCGVGANSGQWSCYGLGNGSALTGQYASLDIGWDDRIHLSYYDGITTSMTYAHSGMLFNGNCGPLATYECIAVDGTGIGQDAGLFTSIVAPKNGADKPRIAYLDKTFGTLKYAFPATTGANCGGGAWFCGEVDSIGPGYSMPVGISLSMDNRGFPVIAYMNGIDDVGPSVLRYARPAAALGLTDGNCGDPLPGSTHVYWQCQTLDNASYGYGNVDLAYYTSIAVSPHGQITIPYYEADWLNNTNSLKVAQSLPIFADVPFTYWAHDFIDPFYYAGITGGCAVSPLRYCPDNSVTRAQMAVFLLKAERGSDFVPPLASGTLFSDVPVSYWAGAWIEQLAAEDITSGCSAGMYCPQNPVTRAQMAVFIDKAFGFALLP